MTSLRIILLLIILNILVGILPVFASIGDSCTTNNHCGSGEYCLFQNGQESGTCASLCGNGTCNSPETYESCPTDCSPPTCPNNICNSWENYYICPQDCPNNCGNGICAGGENPNNCSQDCNCGNGICQLGWESFTNCPTDCPYTPPQTPPCDNDDVCESDERCSCADCSNESQCQPTPDPICPLGQKWVPTSCTIYQQCTPGHCKPIACEMGPLMCSMLQNAVCTYNNMPVDLFVLVDTSSSMALGNRQDIAQTIANSLRITAINTPGSTISFLSFDDHGYRWKWVDGLPSAPNEHGWLRYQFPGNIQSGGMFYGSNPINWPITPEYYNWNNFNPQGSQTNIIEGFNALTYVLGQMPNNPSRQKIVYFLSDGEPTIGSSDGSCEIGQQPCQTNAAASRADQFHTDFPNVSIVAVGLDVQGTIAIDLLSGNIASPGLYTNVSSSVGTSLIPITPCYPYMAGYPNCTQPGPWTVQTFCSTLEQPSHPLNTFGNLYCEEICLSGPGVCGSLHGTTGYSATILQPYSPGMCSPGTVTNFVATPVTGAMNFTWFCESTNGGSGSNQCEATREYCGDGLINGPELCDKNGNIGCSGNTYCNQSCSACASQGGCGYLDGMSIYDFDNNGNSLSGTMKGLCMGGYTSGGEWIHYVPTSFTFNTGNHQRSWQCIPGGGKQGGVLNCNAQELWCGDRTIQNTGLIQFYDQDRQNESVLNSMKKILGWEIGNTPLGVDLGSVSGEYIDNQRSLMETDLGSYSGHHLQLQQFQKPSEQCETHLDCEQGQNCIGCECKTIGLCNPAYEYIYSPLETPGLFDIDSNLCDGGETIGLIYDTHAFKRTYTCQGDVGTIPSTCEIQHLFCGNGFIENIAYGFSEDIEECEPGKPSTCSSTCKLPCDPSKVYPSGSIPGRSCPEGRNLVKNSIMSGGVAVCEDGWKCKREELGIARCLMPECGNGVLDDGEVCDDANVNNNDSCTNTCQRPYCGDGILTPSATWLSGGTITGLIEMCDPLMTGSSRCPGNCLMSGALNVSCNINFPAYLGYGKTFEQINLPGQLCYPYGIASGVTVTTGSRSWNCLSPNGGENAMGCSLPRRRCGDGVVDIWEKENGEPTEECDDGNTDNNDGCSAICTMEPVIEIDNGSGLCTIQSYPQIELGEYLPIWWNGTKTQYLTNYSQCSNITQGNDGVMSASIQGDLVIYRGTQDGLEEVGLVSNVKIAKINTEYSGLITDAIKDFGAQDQPLIGTNIIFPSVVSGWVNTGGIEKYGQYLMRLPKVDYTYCAFARNNIGTVTGEINQLIVGEDCENNYDDNGNGLIDCADTVYCGNEDSCLNSIGTGGNGSGTAIVIETNCHDGIDNPNSLPGIDCADSSCSSATNCMTGIIPENCLTTVDEDGDGQGGCTDLQCVSTPYCQGLIGTENTQANCGDFTSTGVAIDNDNDGFANCNDPQCMQIIPQCYGSNSVCSDNQNDEPFYSYSGSVTNGTGDNDFYLYGLTSVPLIDSKDPQCFLPGQGLSSGVLQMPDGECNNNPIRQFISASCYGTAINAPYGSRTQTYPNTESSCNDNNDNDGDGRNDCSDFDCKDNSSCTSSPPPPLGTGETICDDGLDNDGDGFVNCADGDCSLNPACTVGINENCLNETINDDNDAYVLDTDDPDCDIFYQFEEGYIPIPNAFTKSSEYVYTGSNGYVCEAGFSVSKGYFVQQGFAFSEEANAGLDSSDFVSIGGVPLVTEGTVLDDGENNVSTYSQQGAKAYLFSGFIDTRELKASNNLQVGSDNGLIFKKVPNAHIYFWQGEVPLNGVETLELNEYNRNLLLRKGGVSEGQEQSTPYTIVLPGSNRQGSPKQVLDIQGSLNGNALYISQGDIKFSSSEGSCDSSDTVEGLFIAAGEFTTTPINNRNPLANRRCKGGNLKIRGTLLGSNAGSSLAPLRRSVIDARNPNATFFDNSLVFKAKELFETCYLPALAMRKAGYPIPGTTSQYNGPIAGCNIDSLNTAATRTERILQSKDVVNTFLTTFTSQGQILDKALQGIATTSQMQYVLAMMDNVQSTTTPFVIPNVIIIIQPNGTNQTQININQNSPLITQMQATNKRFPARRFQPLPDGTIPITVTIDMNLPENKIKMMNDVSRAFGEIKDAMVGFSDINKPSGDLKNITNILQNSSLLSKELIKVFQSNLFVNSLSSSNINSNICINSSGQPLCLDISGNIVPNGGICYINTTLPYFHYNNLICHPDFKWLKSYSNIANTQSNTLASNIVDGSSVVISSQPKLWTDLPPGAKDFLNNIVVVPR